MGGGHGRAPPSPGHRLSIGSTTPCTACGYAGGGALGIKIPQELLHFADDVIG